MTHEMKSYDSPPCEFTSFIYDNYQNYPDEISTHKCIRIIYDDYVPDNHQLRILRRDVEKKGENLVSLIRSNTRYLDLDEFIGIGEKKKQRDHLSRYSFEHRFTIGTSITSNVFSIEYDDTCDDIYRKIFDQPDQDIQFSVSPTPKKLIDLLIWRFLMSYVLRNISYIDKICNSIHTEYMCYRQTIPEHDNYYNWRWSTPGLLYNFYDPFVKNRLKIWKSKMSLTHQHIIDQNHSIKSIRDTKKYMIDVVLDQMLYDPYHWKQFYLNLNDGLDIDGIIIF